MNDQLGQSGDRQDAPLSLGFQRQKRGLVIMSLFLIFVSFSEPDFSKAGIKLFNISLNEPESILTILWLIFSLYLWRWIQHIFQIGFSDISRSWAQDFIKNVNSRISEISRWLEGEVGEGLQTDLVYNIHPKIFPAFRFSINRVEEEGSFIVLGPISDGNNIKGDYVIPLRHVFMPAFRATLRSVFLRPMFVETFGPFFLALAAIVSALIC